jgi:hypothetical protein
MGKQVIKLGIIFLLGFGAFSAPQALAGYFETSFGFMFYRTNYSEESFNSTQRWTASISYRFFGSSGLELALQDSTEKTYIEGFQDTEFRDRVYSLNWIQAILPKGFLFQPFFKVGLGQLNRDAKGTYGNGSSPPARYDTLTAVGGLGTRIHLTQRFGLRAEANTYLAEADIGNWGDNVSFTVGGSFYF